MKSARNRGRKKARFSGGNNAPRLLSFCVCARIYIYVCMYVYIYVCAPVAITDDPGAGRRDRNPQDDKDNQGREEMKERNRSCSADSLPSRGRHEDTERKEEESRRKILDQREQEKEVAIEREAGRRG